MPKKEYIKIAQHDAERCQFVNPTKGQCNMKKIPPGEQCIYHGGQILLNSQAKTELNNLRITQFKGRVAELANSDKVFNLYDEIGVLRMTLEETLNSCCSATDLLLQTNKISELVGRIEKVVTACQKLERISGEHLSKTQLNQFAAQIITIISEICPDNLDSIIERIQELEALC